ncbi:MAG: hypothetical protein QXH42_08450 [Thermoplasmata archaeon]
MDLATPFLVGAIGITGVCAHYLRREPRLFAAVYIWCMGLLIAVMLWSPGRGDRVASALMSVSLLTGLVMLGVGYLMHSKPQGHLTSIVGWQAFGIYWMLEVPNYVSLHPDDPINVLLYAPALALFTVFSIYEWRAWKSGVDRRALRFITGMTFVAAGTYFLFAKVPALSSALIWATAAQTSWLYNLLGASTVVGGPVMDAATGEISVPVIGSGISIILACTGIEAIVIFLGAFLCIEPRENPWGGYKRIGKRIKKYMKMSWPERRARALLYTIPPIWVLNLVRNISIIWLVNSGTTSFDVAHGYLGKLFSFLVLLALAMIVFDLVPEIYDDLLELYRLGRAEEPRMTDGMPEDGGKPVERVAGAKGESAVVERAGSGVGGVESDGGTTGRARGTGGTRRMGEGEGVEDGVSVSGGVGGGEASRTGEREEE